MRELHRELIHIGFTENEAQVYLALLEGGRMRVGDLLQKIAVHRSTLYGVLKQLEEKGLIILMQVEGVKWCIAQEPRRIVQFLDWQRQELDRRVDCVNGLLTQLNAMHNASQVKPKIRCFEGVSGLRRMQKEYETYEEDMIQLLGYDAFMALHDPDVTSEHRSVVGSSRKIRSVIVTDHDLQFGNEFSLEYRQISPSICSVDGEVTVCGDRVVLFAYTQSIIAIEITSPVIAQTMRTTLELAWKEAGRLHEVLHGPAKECD